MSRETRVGHVRPLPYAGLPLVILLFIPGLTASPPLSAAPRRVFVAEFDKRGDARLRKDLIKELAKSKEFQVVDSPSAADLILDGTTELYVRGYYSLWVRAGTAPGHGNPLYGGYSSVELKSPSGETVWSYLATLREATTDPSRELSHDIAKHLLQSAISANPPQR